MEPKSISPRIRWIGLAVFVVVCLGVGGLGAVATVDIAIKVAAIAV